MIREEKFVFEWILTANFNSIDQIQPGTMLTQQWYKIDFWIFAKIIQMTINGIEPTSWLEFYALCSLIESSNLKCNAKISSIILNGKSNRSMFRNGCWCYCCLKSRQIYNHLSWLLLLLSNSVCQKNVWTFFSNI